MSDAWGLFVPEWFRRFGDIPGVTYAPPEQLDRQSLAGCDDVPEVHTFRFSGQLEETLSWPVGDGSRGGSASPAHYRAFSAFPDTREVPAAALLRNVYEGLELPGEPPDYHLLVQNTAGALWQRRRNEPDLLSEIERLCWLDIGLIQARPDAASDLIDGQTRLYSITGFWILIQLYEDRGDLADGLKVAEIAASYGQCEDARQRLRWKTGARETEPVPHPMPVPPQHPNGGQPPVQSGTGRISDWGYRSGEADGPFAGGGVRNPV